MKRLLWIIVAMAGLVAVVTGCDGMHRYDGRLAAVDSLMLDDPDSALALVEAIDAGSLTTDGDRAYRDLLLTQARYRCYIAATSDSAINRALAYYRAHDGEREKLTRCHLYKGAVMEELGQVDSAMFYYKTAEATAAPDDYFNLGYANLRMGDLYGSYFAMDGKDIDKYEKALDLFSRTASLEYQSICLNNLGCLYRESNPQKAQHFLLRSLEISKNLNDTCGLISSEHSLMILYHYNHDYYKGYQVLRQFNELKIKPNDYKLQFCLSNVYARMGIMDSALLCSTRARECSDKTALYELYYYDNLGELALARKDQFNYLKFSQISEQIADSLKSNVQKRNISQVENEVDLISKHNMEHDYGRKRILTSLIILGLVLFIITASIVHYRRMHRFDSLIENIKDEMDHYKGDLARMNETIDDLQIRDSELMEFIYSNYRLMGDVANACYHAPRNKLSNEIKHLFEYNEHNREMWLKLYDYLDIQYNNIMSFTRTEYPQLNERDLLLVALTALDYSYIQTAIITGYNNATSISGNKQRLAKKMGLPGTLNDYIESFKD